MNPTPAQQLGAYIRSRREEMHLSTRQLAKLSGLTQPTVMHIEHGEFQNPRPQKLKALAEVLKLPLTDLLSLAGYVVESELPSPLPFLRAKYRDMPEAALEALAADVASVLKRHGVDPYGRPAGNEDEIDDQEEAQSAERAQR